VKRTPTPPPPKRKGRIARRREKAVAAAIRAGWKPGAALSAAAILQAACPHVPLPLIHAALPLPWAGIGLGGTAVWYGRDALDARLERRSGGKRAMRIRRRYQGTATPREVGRNLSPRAARSRAGGIHAVHVEIGDAKGRMIAGSAEDTYLLAAPPRSGKSALLGCWITDAPGAVLATSTRADLYAHTAIPRSEQGPLWVLNPDGDGGIPSTLAWDPVDGCENPAKAMQRAGYLMDAAPKDTSGKDAWWDHQAKTFLQYLLHAAALVPGTTIWDVRNWASGVLADAAPIDALASNALAAPGWGRELLLMAGRMNADENYGGAVCNGVMTALAWLSDPAMAAAACPRPGTGFDMEGFVRGACGTIYLIGADKPHGSLAPYFAAFTAELFETAKRVASCSPGTRLPVPLTLALDEAPIVCPVPLHKWMSESGGHGITVMAAIQAMSQLRDRWGEQPGKTIFTNATVKVIYGGFTDHEDLEALSAVCGQRDTWDHHKSSDGSKTRAPRQERAVPPERIRMLGKWEVLVLHRSTRPVFATITPVWDRAGYQPAPLGAAAFAEQYATVEPLAIEPSRRREPIVMGPAGPPAITDADASPIPAEEQFAWLSQQEPTSRSATGTVSG
jgi:type IV secretion system protein VirD4